MTGLTIVIKHETGEIAWGHMPSVQKWVRVLAATPTINCLQVVFNGGLKVVFNLSSSPAFMVTFWTHSYPWWLVGLNMVAILESFTLDYSSYGQVARFIVLMEFNKVQLENIIYHVILL